MPKTFFTRGTPVTAEFLNALNNPQFVANPDDDGQLPQIDDTRLSQANGQLLDRANRFMRTFEFRAGAGRTLELFTPNRIRSNGQAAVGGSWQQFNLPPNASGEIWLNWVNGTYQVATYPNTNLRPSASLSLCLWTTSTTTVTSFTELQRGYRHVDSPATQSLVLFGGRGLTDGVWNAPLTLAEERYSFNNLTINLGSAGTITMPRSTLVQVAGNLTIVGTGSIIVEASVAGTGQVVSNTGSGLITYNPVAGSSSGTFNGYSWTAGQPGNAGRSGSGICAAAGGTSGNGGNGGSFLRFQVGGTITQTGTVLIICDGSNGTGSTFVNAASAGHVFLMGGGNGGSGGLIHFQAGEAIRWNGSVQLSVRGGSGGPPTQNVSAAGTWAAVGGAGAGGGWVVEEAPIITGTPTYILTGGGFGGFTGATPAIGIGGGGQGAGYGGEGGFTFLNPPTAVIAGDEAIPVGGAWWYRPSKPGEQVRLLRYPILLS